MKKLFLAILMAGLMAGIVYADCTVTVDLTVSTDPNAETHYVYYDPDNTVGGDEFIPTGCSGTLSVTQCVFTIAAPLPNDEVWVLTENATGTESYESPHVPVGGIAGSTVSTVIVNCN